MSEVIKLLEKLGQDIDLLTNENIEARLSKLDIDSELKSAILKRDINSLEQLLDVREKIFCGIIPAEDDEPAKEEPQENDTDNVKSLMAS